MRAAYEEELAPPRQRTELTLGPGTLLLIFFCAAAICGGFFGFSYSLGRPAANPAALPGETAAGDAPSLHSGKPKPSAGSPVGTSAPDTSPMAMTYAGVRSFARSLTSHMRAGSNSAPAADTAAEAVPAQPASRAQTETAPANPETPGSDRGAPSVPSKELPPSAAGETRASAPPRTHALPPLTAPSAIAESRPASPASHYALPPAPHAPLMVQIAAVSREEDANALAAALRKRGFSPMVRSGLSDNFFHVQVGPFADKAEAEAMKQQLAADGYNAILH